MTESRDFWTRRKEAVEAEKHAEERTRDDQEVEEARRALAEKPDEEVLAELNLPDPDSLGQGDNFTAFMGKAVPERLRKRALRRLWLSNPVLANLDELVDYGEDFTDAATVVENLQTVYQVGKGMVRDEDRESEPAEGEPETSETETSETETTPESGQDEDAETAAAGDASDPEAAEEDPEPTAATGDDTGEVIAAEPEARRHIRFAFEDAEEVPDGPLRGRRQ